MPGKSGLTYLRNVLQTFGRSPQSHCKLLRFLRHRSAGLGRTRLFHPWAHEPEGGWSGANVYVSHVVGPGQGSGLMGLVGSRWVPSGHVRVPYGSVYQSYTKTGQSSDPWGLVGSRRSESVSDGFPSEPCFGTTGPDMARRIARLSRIGARLMYGPPGHASPRALRRPIRT